MLLLMESSVEPMKALPTYLSKRKRSMKKAGYT